MGSCIATMNLEHAPMGNCYNTQGKFIGTTFEARSFLTNPDSKASMEQ